MLCCDCQSYQKPLTEWFGSLGSKDTLYASNQVESAGSVSFGGKDSDSAEAIIHSR